MKKLVLSVTALLMLALGTWIFWPEYGSGYSEEQRRLWNEKRSLYPAITLIEVDIDDPRGFSFFSGLKTRDAENLFRNKKEITTRLDSSLKSLHDSHAPDFEYKQLTLKDPNLQNYEGLSYHELKHLAGKNNPDPCLLAISRSPFYSRYGLAGMSWEGVHEIRRLLYQASMQKRTPTEADFLLRLIPALQRQFADQKISAALSSSLIDSFFYSPPIQLPHFENITGFDNFINLVVEQENCNACHVLKMLLPEKTKTEISGFLYDTLKRQASQGDITAMKKLAQLHFGTHLHYANMSYFPYQEVEQKMNHFMARWCPPFVNGELKKTTVRFLINLGIFSSNDSSEWGRYREASYYAYKAAQDGDMDAMYLWLRFGIVGKNHFSREEWENIFIFTHRLLEASYFPFIEFMDVLPEKHSTSLLLHEILETFYSTPSYNQLRTLCAQATVSRNQQGAYKGHSIIGTNDTLRLIEHRSDSGKNKTPEELERESLQGNPEAMYMLALLYMQGNGVSKNPEKSYKLLNQALEETPPY